MNKPLQSEVDFNSPDFDENPEWTEENFARARPASEIHPPHVVAALIRKRDLNEAAVRQQVTLELDTDVIEKFRGTGPDWVNRINEVLRAAEPRGMQSDAA